MAEIRIEGVSKTYRGGVEALREVQLTVRDRECLVLLGPSGCGKTTLLRLIAGFETPETGTILVGGRDLTDVPIGKRGIGMVFQSYALFPHLRVRDNIAFGLRMTRVPGPEVRRRVAEAAAMMEVSGLLDRYPSEISGGERQRVAVARAVVPRPAIILMDEPLSNLDAQLRDQMRGELKRLLGELRTTAVYVTHDQEEALSIGDRVAVMNDGRIMQCDTPRSVYDRPSSRFVAEFVGRPPMNVLRATRREHHVTIEGRQFLVGFDDGDSGAGHRRQEVLVGVRAESVRVAREQGPDALEASVKVIEVSGPRLLLSLVTAHGQQAVRAHVDVDFLVQPGDRVWLRLRGADLRLLEPTDDS